jgi:hypothetical protein
MGNGIAHTFAKWFSKINMFLKKSLDKGMATIAAI